MKKIMDCFVEDPSDWYPDEIKQLIRKYNFLFQIVEDLIKNEEFCPICGCRMGMNDHLRFCRIGFFKRGTDINDFEGKS